MVSSRVAPGASRKAISSFENLGAGYDLDDIGVTQPLVQRTNAHVRRPLLIFASGLTCHDASEVRRFNRLIHRHKPFTFTGLYRKPLLCQSRKKTTPTQNSVDLRPVTGNRQSTNSTGYLISPRIALISRISNKQCKKFIREIREIRGRSEDK